MTKYADLIRRVAEGTGADWTLDYAVLTALGNRYEVDTGTWHSPSGAISPPQTMLCSSIDAARAQVERALPRSLWQLSADPAFDAKYQAEIALTRHAMHYGESSSPARALLIALLTALSEQEKAET